MNTPMNALLSQSLKTLLTLSALTVLTPLAATAAAADADMTHAEVRKVDADSGKLTLKHGPIKNLDMPAMTMVFVVKDKAQLANVKAGDKVKFTAVNDAGRYTVTEIKPAP